MNIASAKQQVKDTVEAYLQKDDTGIYRIAPVHQRPIFLLGAPGIGKTAIMEQVARELEIGIVSYSMTHHTRQSALGLPRIEHHEFEGFEYEASEYTMSEIVASIYAYIERTGLRDGILFLDEINCVSETLYPSMLQFLQFKTFGKHKIPDGWVVICAGNPPEYNRSVHEFDIVTLDRMRQIDVEPDYAAWKEYASQIGMHPSVTTFLETKQDCFYKVESKAGGGKAFVTARGWDDLACIIELYEDMGKPVDRELIVQFLRDETIADQFSVYYALFEKYRSDYQVDSILAGQATDQVKERAHNAAFDERIALIGLLIDALANDCTLALEKESLALDLRDTLRDAKSELLSGATAENAVGSRTTERERDLSRKISSGTIAPYTVRKERLVIDRLRSFVAQCTIEKAVSGKDAFRVIEAKYKEDVAEIEPHANAASEKMDNAFDFLDSNLDSREMLVFIAGLMARRSTTQFIAHFGNEGYYTHNQDLQVDSARTSLAERAKRLNDLDLGIDDEPAAVAEAVRDAEADAPSSAGSGTDKGHSADMAPSVSALPVNTGANTAVSINSDVLREHYGSRQFEYGFASMCKMVLPVNDLQGRQILDICCRRGKGVYKLSAMTGEKGNVIGIDWSSDYISEAQNGMHRAWKDSGLSHNNMEFRVAYPEALVEAGIKENSVDVIYVNNVITLFYDQAKVIDEFARVLKSGGLLVMETVFADRARDDEVVKKAQVLGNSIQAARTKQENYDWLKSSGFNEPSVVDEYDVKANRGYQEGSVVDIVTGDEDVRYKAVALYVYKK